LAAKLAIILENEQENRSKMIKIIRILSRNHPFCASLCYVCANRKI